MSFDKMALNKRLTKEKAYFIPLSEEVSGFKTLRMAIVAHIFPYSSEFPWRSIMLPSNVKSRCQRFVKLPGAMHIIVDFTTGVHMSLRVCALYQFRVSRFHDKERAWSQYSFKIQLCGVVVLFLLAELGLESVRPTISIYWRVADIVRVGRC